MMDQFIRVTDSRHDDVIFLDNPDFAFKPGIKACITEGLYAGVVGEVKRIQKTSASSWPSRGLLQPPSSMCPVTTSATSPTRTIAN